MLKWGIATILEKPGSRNLPHSKLEIVSRKKSDMSCSSSLRDYSRLCVTFEWEDSSEWVELERKRLGLIVMTVFR